MDALKVELSQYEAQLSQIQMAISASADGPEKDNLITLEKDITELIKLTKDSLQPNEDQETKSDPDPLADEYKLFQAELAVIDSDKNDEERESVQLDDTKVMDLDGLHSDLKSMEGMKCQAPYKYAWTEDVTYHNALIFCIEDLDTVTNSDDIQVRVMFTNPTHKEMLPCPYYLDGECKFSDEKCRFSHGEKVFLNSLRDYRDPDFGILTEGRPVLAKKDDGLWHRAVIKSIDGVKAIVKFDSNFEEEIHFQNILPLEGSDGSDESDSDSENDNLDDQTAHNEEIVRRILMAPPSSALGDWEKFTKGFGSRIMAKMGYIHGSGLGREGKGRVEPVSAVILPAGKSLDHCMMLREHSGGDKDFFKAEKRMKQIQKKQEKMLQRSYEREKNRTDVFMFLNKNLGQSNKNESRDQKNTQKQLQSESTRSLNVTSLQLAEEVRKVEKEVKSLKNSLSRYSNQSKEFSVLKEKLNDRQTKLSQLKASEQRIANEQELRRDRKKLTVF
ncbi:UNVERIFIED_CONTAM: hypothetical protein PYX00_006599 [Menopon gallinae]|uniref:Zinc finger CCCH-type with G patch domain-containing protein n=1 Tax=Menopon gallinae TaxID=328185 RepID=A0AAW2HXF9_9NEOP